MQIKTTWDTAHNWQNGYHQQINKQQVLVRMWRKGTLWALLVGMQFGAATVESSIELLQIIKYGTALWISDFTSWICLKKPETITWNNIFIYPYVHWSIIHNNQDLKSAQVSISGWVDKKTVVYLCNGILLSCKKRKEILNFATAWTYLDSIKLGEISQSEKDKYHMVSLIRGINEQIN